MKPGDSKALAAYVKQQAPRYGLDPKAVLAVASQEGLGGGIGDNGTSFGPWQLHKGGAYPSSAPQSATAANQWAWDPAGVNYALGRMSSVAGGQKGAQAVHSIVYDFERPTNPAAEYQGALRAYNGGGGGSAFDTALGVLNDVTNPVGAAVGAVGGAAGAVSGTESALGSIGTVLGDLTSASFWLRGVEVIGGGAMIFLGVYLLTRQAGIAPPASGVAKTALAVAVPEAGVAEGVAAGV